MKTVKDMFTEADGTTWDLGRMQWFVGTVVYFVLSAWAYGYHRQPFDPVLWGTGFAAVLASGGGMIWLKGHEK